jgi:hypothetical protein
MLPQHIAAPNTENGASDFEDHFTVEVPQETDLDKPG